jgi:hypothetical protein
MNATPQAGDHVNRGVRPAAAAMLTVSPGHNSKVGAAGVSEQLIVALSAKDSDTRGIAKRVNAHTGIWSVGAV